MMNFDSKITGIDRIKNGVLSAAKHKQAQANTINKLSSISRNYIQSDIMDNYNLDLDEIRIKRRKADKNYLISTLIASRKQFPLIKFDPVQTERGVEVRIRRDRKTMRKRAFISEVWGHENVFKRKKGSSLGNKGGYQLVGRFPIQKQKGPSIGGLLGSKYSLNQVNRIIKTRSGQIYKVELEKLIKT